MEGLLARASEIYAVDYFGAIIIVALLESIVPRRAAGDALKLRWTSNFGIALLGTVIMKTLLPAFGLLGAALSHQYGIGLLNYVTLPQWMGLVVTVLTLDLVAYGQHYLLHRVDWLWRIHRTHHSDNDCDFTTGVRFHPLEAMITGRDWFCGGHGARRTAGVRLHFGAARNLQRISRACEYPDAAHPRPHAAAHAGDAGDAPHSPLKVRRR